ncbi:hypothetical protein NHQ30_011670 [Ciborinia camelliae]|nr:hypothetical protein NHQ30_011670 [Ciborinia camelliae]
MGPEKPTLDGPIIDCSDESNIQVKMIGAAGNDRYGEMFIVELNENGVDASGIVTVPNTRSSICFVILEELTRENRCLFTLGATATWKKEDFIDAEQLGGGIRPDLDLVQIEIEKEVVETMIETAGKANIELCLNASPAAPIGKLFYKHLTHLLVNESEAAIMSGRDRDEVNEDTWMVICRELLSRGVKNVVITLGSKGAFYANTTGIVHCPTFNVKGKGTTGAGDTFTWAYASEYLQKKKKGVWDIRSAVIRAYKAAAIMTQSVGAQDRIPWADVHNFDALQKVFSVIRSSSIAGIAGEA